MTDDITARYIQVEEDRSSAIQQSPHLLYGQMSITSGLSISTATTIASSEGSGSSITDQVDVRPLVISENPEGEKKVDATRVAPISSIPLPSASTIASNDSSSYLHHNQSPIEPRTTATSANATVSDLQPDLSALQQGLDVIRHALEDYLGGPIDGPNELVQPPTPAAAEEEKMVEEKEEEEKQEDEKPRLPTWKPAGAPVVPPGTFSSVSRKSREQLQAEKAAANKKKQFDRLILSTLEALVSQSQLILQSCRAHGTRTCDEMKQLQSEVDQLMKVGCNLSTSSALRPDSPTRGRLEEDEEMKTESPLKKPKLLHQCNESKEDPDRTMDARNEAIDLTMEDSATSPFATASSPLPDSHLTTPPTIASVTSSSTPIPMDCSSALPLAASLDSTVADSASPECTTVETALVDPRHHTTLLVAEMLLNLILLSPSTSQTTSDASSAHTAFHPRWNALMMLREQHDQFNRRFLRPSREVTSNLIRMIDACMDNCGTEMKWMEIRLKHSLMQQQLASASTPSIAAASILPPFDLTYLVGFIQSIELILVPLIELHAIYPDESEERFAHMIVDLHSSAHSIRTTLAASEGTAATPSDPSPVLQSVWLELNSLLSRIDPYLLSSIKLVTPLTPSPRRSPSKKKRAHSSSATDAHPAAAAAAVVGPNELRGLSSLECRLEDGEEDLEDEEEDSGDEDEDEADDLEDFLVPDDEDVVE